MKSHYTKWVITLASAIGLQILAASIPELVRSLFVRPSGFIASCMLGQSNTIWTGDTYEFMAGGLHIQVSTACSGFGFFTLLAAVLLYNLWPLQWHRAIWLPLISWFGSIVINAVRIVTSVFTRLLSQQFLPNSFQEIIHQATGTLVFLSALVLILFILQYYNHVRNRFQASPTPAS